MVTTMTTTTWTPTTHADYDRLKGRDVVSADGEKLGSVEAIFHPPQAMPEARGGHYFLVKPGLLKNWFGGGEAFYVPESAIASVTADAVTLGFGTESLQLQGWDQKPAGIGRFNRA